MFDKIKNSIDIYLLEVILILMLFGLVMVFSASSMELVMKNNSPYGTFLRQGAFVLAGIFVMVATSFIDYKLWKKLAPVFYYISLVLLLLLFTSMGIERNNATRWIKIGIELQPSEVAKLAVILMVSSIISRYKEETLDKFMTFIKIGTFVIIPCVLVYLQPSLSSATTVLIIGVSIMVASGIKLRYIFLGAAGVLPFAAFMIMKQNYMIGRITALFDRWGDAQDGGFQLLQSLYALANGGLFGVGLGNSTQKFQYIPEAQNDFIFAIIGEELGFIGSVTVVALYGFFILRGLRISNQCSDEFGRLVAFGITVMIGFQAFFNILVAIGLAPTTGVSLPLISSGGSSFIVFSFSMGILLNISKKKRPKRIQLNQ